MYRKELITVHPSRQFLSRSIPEAELAVSEGVLRTPVFALRTRRWMSGIGCKPTSGDPLWNVRIEVISRHSGARSRPPFLGGVAISGFPYSSLGFTSARSIYLQLTTGRKVLICVSSVPVPTFKGGYGHEQK